MSHSPGIAGHQSDCSTHNEPAYPNGKCDCGYEAQGIAEDIRKALDAATPGPWEVTSRYSQGYLAVRSKDELVASVLDESIAHLIANAPTWLRSLLEEREELIEVDRKRDRQYHQDGETIDDLKSQLQQLEQELDLVKKAWNERRVIAEQLREELEHLRSVHNVTADKGV